VQNDLLDLPKHLISIAQGCNRFRNDFWNKKSEILPDTKTGKPDAETGKSNQTNSEGVTG
jgi:hypothetical protein